MRPSVFHSVSPWRIRRRRDSATRAPEPAIEKPGLRARQLREHAGVGGRRLEAHAELEQLVASESVQSHRFACTTLRQRRVQAAAPRAEPVDGYDRIAR